jgi:hypothetical protein
VLDAGAVVVVMLHVVVVVVVMACPTLLAHPMKDGPSRCPAGDLGRLPQDRYQRRIRVRSFSSSRAVLP